jgi:dihydropteroate synthase
MFSLNCNGRLVSLHTPLVMGILNLTSDSFYEGSRLGSTNDVLERADKMLSEGADILDIGGQSTRPGSNRLTAKEELQKVIPAIKAILQKHPTAILSIDTYHAEVASAAVKAGVAIVNDISAGNMDTEMINTVAALGVPYICMHMKGTPETMQHEAHYADVTKEVLDFFIQKTYECKNAGIKDIIIDPGFGFGKTIEHNYELLSKLELLRILDVPLMVGLSRKATIYKTLGVTAAEALNGTTVLNTIAVQKGANILRVHDVKEAKEVIQLTSRLTTLE